MISLDELVKEGLLEMSDLPDEIDVTTADFFKVLIPALQMSTMQDVHSPISLPVVAVMSLRILALPVPLGQLSIKSCPKRWPRMAADHLEYSSSLPKYPCRTLEGVSFRLVPLKTLERHQHTYSREASAIQAHHLCR